MRLIDRVLSRQQGYHEAMYSGAYVVASDTGAGRGKEGPPPGFPGYVRDIYAANGPVFAAIQARLMLFSQARFKFQAATDGHLYGNQDLRILEHPWPNGQTGDLLARLEQDGGSLAGNGYVRKAVPADGSDEQLVRMRPDTVTIISEEVTDEMGRVFKRPRGYSEDLKPLGYMDREPQIYSVDEVAHWAPVPDPLANWRGMSWLTPLLREIRGDQGMTEYKVSHISRGAMPGIVLKYSQKLSETAVDRLKKRFAALYGGPENAGKTLVLDEGADLTVAGSSLEQLQFAAVQQAGEVRIAQAAGLIPPPGFAGSSEMAARWLADMTMRPNWQSVCAALEVLVPHAAERDGVRLWYDVSGIAALREGELARSQATLVKMQAVGAAVTAGYTRESAVAAADSGDLSQLVADPGAAAPGAPSGVRRPQAGVPEDLPGVVKPNVPNALPWTNPPMPSLPNGARG